jgi:hypothetical protein
MIVTEKIMPPIPTTMYDWAAWIEGEEEGGITGRGPTECEALRDLAEQLAVLWLESQPAPVIYATENCGHNNGRAK